ncbi:uncharacterized protein LOC117322794 [Pecten maximus]|uniref:uncharacterized protein LOC117322794 n=1 Tax=Pecten maximus TaxID=6579 RepID=UPI0014584731|nr:uncharacterized protein LOC117322794 [Pecten maximus]
MDTCYCLHIIVLFLSFSGFTCATNNIFLGGTINWRSIGGQTRFTYRLTWLNGYGPCGPGCSNKSIGKLTTGGAPFDTTFWQTNGGHVIDLNYITTTISSDWEQGERAFNVSSTTSMRFLLRLNTANIAWIVTGNGIGGSGVFMETFVDMSMRNDTKEQNASPIAALPPYIGASFGCLVTINLPVTEPDHDLLECRWARAIECGSACTNLPQAYIDKSACTITINTTADRGYSPGQKYRVTVVVEDFPRFPILMGRQLKLPTDPLSMIPLQFTITVTKSTSCVSHVQFVTPSLPDELHASYSMFPQALCVRSIPYSTNIKRSCGTDFLSSLPAGMMSQRLADDQKRQNVTRLYLTWLPERRQMGDNLACVWGKDQFGLTTSQRCVDALISDTDECRSSPCQRGGKCVNLFHRFVCDCPPGLMPPLCSRRITCGDQPCLNSGTCRDSNSSFTCTCPQGFSGDRCQKEKNMCQSFPCQNGGTCHSHHGTFTCSCPILTTGVTCLKKTTTKKNDTKQNLNITVDNVVHQQPWVILASVLSGVLGAALLGSCCIWGLSKFWPFTKGTVGTTSDDTSSTRNTKRPGKLSKSGQRNDQDSPRRPGSYRPFSISSQIGLYPQSTTLTPMETGVLAPPQYNNIYSSSLTDPLMHKCGRV